MIIFPFTVTGSAVSAGSATSVLGQGGEGSHASSTLAASPIRKDGVLELYL